MRTYRTEARAYKRAGYLRRLGIWTGVIHVGNQWRLAYDPEV